MPSTSWQQQPNAKIGILYQNDDFGKDYLRGVRDVLKDRYDDQVHAVSMRPQTRQSIASLSVCNPPASTC